MLIEQDEAGLTARARQGDKEAYGELYERYLDTIYQYIYYRVGHHHEAEDLTEQVFLKAWEGIGRFREEVPFKAWIYRIAHNTVIDHYRRQKDVLELEDQSAIPHKNPGIEEKILSAERTAQLAKAIGRLSPLHQHVLILRFINGFTMKETAQILDRSQGTVRVLQHRALKAAYAFLTAEEITND
jgi:RNA polymerase sigma-70 factor (ECF subfamily)